MIRFNAAIVFCMFVSGSAHAGLVGYWDFDGNVMDKSGLDNHGELIGAQYDNDVPAALGAGQSLSFEDPLEHVFVAADPSLDSSVFTLSMFINDQEQFEGVNRLTSRQSDTFETGIDKVFGSDSLSYYSPTAGWVRTGFIPDLDEWHHLAYVADGDTMTVYVDGDAEFGPEPFQSFPSGFLHIGNRWNDVEGFFGLIDDVALWDAALPAESIAELANGTKSPPQIPIPDPPPPPPKPFLSVASNVDTWTLSTESVDGGPRGEWEPSDDSPPAVETFTLEPLATEAGVVGHIDTAAGRLDVEGIQADNDTHYYRTTFDLDRATGFNAELQLAVDNGAQVYINGELIATETSFLVENWGFPLPSLSFAEDGEIEVTKFEDAADSYRGWLVGENEIILAVRNPFDEGLSSGGFAFRLDFFGSGSRGDFDGNGVVDAVDIDLLNDQIGGAQDADFDLNGDGAVDDSDRDTMVAEVLETYYGDSNLDHEFNSSDLVVVFTASEYDDELLFNSGWATGDWNGDKEFNSSDLVVAFTEGGYNKGPRIAAEPVPEPSQLVLLITGLIGAAIGRRIVALKSEPPVASRGVS